MRTTSFIRFWRRSGLAESGLTEVYCTCACPEKQFALKFFTLLNILFTSTFRIFEQLALALKNSVPWIHCTEYIFFMIRDFWTAYACPDKQSSTEIFHCIEVFFIIQDFWATCAWPENRVCPEIFQAGGAVSSPVARFGGAKYIFRGTRIFFYYIFETNFSGNKKFWGGSAPECPPVATGLGGNPLRAPRLVRLC